MERVLPTSFLFRYALPVARCSQPGNAAADTLPVEYRLAEVSGLDNASSFAELRIGWHESGLGVSVNVTGKQQPLRCDRRNPAESDGLQLWIDTRNTQNIHRASRFCHHFCLLPTAAGRKKDRPIAVPLAIARAREDAPLADPAAIPINATVSQNGYALDAWLPADVLNGYDPESAPRLGFFYCVRDAELGNQTLALGPEFPYAHDPSLWATLELTGKTA